MIRNAFKAFKNSSKAFQRATTVSIAGTRPASTRVLTRTTFGAGITNFWSPGLIRFFGQANDDAAGNTPVIKLKNLEQWEELLGNSEQAYCVDFYADWCGPCRALLPLLEQRVNKLAEGGDGNPVVLIKVNVDEFGEIAQALGVSTIPHVFLVKGGEVVDQFVGRVDDTKLDEFFAKA